MSKTALMFLALLGIVVLYFFALIIVTIIVDGILLKGVSDDYDYAMIANVIQFTVMVIIFAEKVVRWIN